MTTKQPSLLSFVPLPKPSETSPVEVASEHSLLEIDQEIDLMLDQMQDEVEEHGEIAEGSRIRFQTFCEAFGEKVDRLGRFIRVLENREAYCRSEAARLTARARSAECKVNQTKALVLYFLESRSLSKIEGPQFTLRRQKNSADTVRIKAPNTIPMRLMRVEARFDGTLWTRIVEALPEDLKRNFAASLQSSSPSNDAIKQEITAGMELEGVSVKRGYHLRVA